MSVRQLVNLIEKMNVVDDKILSRIRREIDDPEKNVKPKAILSFLVKKEQLTKKQATKLLKESQQVAVDEIEIKPEPKNSHDTDNLIGLSPADIEVEVEAEVEVEVEPEIEVEVEVEVEVESDIVEVEVDPVEVEVDPVEIEAVVPAPVQGLDPLDTYADPLAVGGGGGLDPMSAGLDAGVAEQPQPRKTGTGQGFRLSLIHI